MPRPERQPGLRAALDRLAGTWHQARRYRDFSALLACQAALARSLSSLPG